MLISGVPESEVSRDEDTQHHYQTAQELFELIAIQDPNSEENTSLTAGDLVLLYQNLELGTHLVTSCDVARHNQHVETIVYAEDTDSFSETSEGVSAEDIFEINNERLDLLTQPTNSYDLSYKYGDLQLQTQNLSREYKNHALFNDPFIKEQLLEVNTTKKAFGTNILPPSLLDYLTCKRLEDNYNFYMDSIINYVKSTIEQLQRISNGDYLTEKAKEKWKEPYNVSATALSLANNYQMVPNIELTPMGNEILNSKRCTLWDEIVHSEVDFKTLTKILEKKIVIEVPKTICSQFKFLSKYCSENLIFNCIKDKENKADESAEDLNALVHVKKPRTGDDGDNIKSVVISKSPVTESIPALLEPPNVEPCLPYIEYHNEDMLNVTKTSDDKYDSESVYLTGKEVDNDSSEHPKPLNEFTKLSTELSELSTEISKLSIELPNLSMEPPNPSEPSTQPELTKPSTGNQQSKLEALESENQIDMKATDVRDESYEGIQTTLKKNSEDVDQYESQHAGNDIVEEFELAMDESVCDSHEECASDVGYNTSNSNDDETCDVSMTSDMNRILITQDHLQTIIVNGPMPSARDYSREGIMHSVLEEIKSDTSNLSVKKSPTKLKGKSPYENKSYSIEEKRRRKLLAIRERREKKKMSMQEAKSTVHKKPKLGTSSKNAMPQSSHSVTKLSITNKSFYNSIFGPSSSTSSKKHSKHDVILEIPQEYDFNEDEQGCSALTSADRTDFVNKSFYMDETDIAVCYIKSKSDDADGLSTYSARYTMNDSRYLNNLNTFIKDNSILEPHSTSISLPNESIRSSQESHSLTKIVSTTKTTLALLDLAFESPRSPTAPEPTPVTFNREMESTPGDCRESIKKVYSLLKKLSNKKKNVPEKDRLNSESDFNEWKIYDDDYQSTRIDVTESSIMTDKNILNNEPHTERNMDQNTNVMVNTKRTRASQKMLFEGSKKGDKTDNNAQTRKNRKDKLKDTPENPLKVISNILNEIDNAQKKVKKNEAKPVKNREPVKELKKVKPEIISRTSSPDKTKDKKSKSSDRNVKDNKEIVNRKKKLSDFIDEAREARGEAVKGPRSRLDALALPRKSYVQAHSEEYQNKYGRNLMSDRLQRLAKGSKPPGKAQDKSGSPSRTLQKGVRRKETPQPINTGPVHVTGPVNVNEHGPKAFRRGTKEAAPKPRNNEQVKPSALKSDNKKKMEEVECYVQNHYGQYDAESTETRRGHRRRVKRSHVMFIENDEELSDHSAYKSDVIVDWPSEINTNIVHGMEADDIQEDSDKVEELTTVTEDNQFQLEKCASIKDAVSVPSVFADHTIKTAVGELTKSCRSNATSDWDSEIEKLESALYTQVSRGKFNKRLRLKSITLTPKHSLKQMMFFKPKNAASLTLKPSSSLDFNNSFCPSKSKDKINLRKAPSLSMGFEFPMQISTIGYVLTHHGGPTQDVVISNDTPTIIINAVDEPTSNETLITSSEENESILRELKYSTTDESAGPNTSQIPPVKQNHDTNKISVNTETTNSLLDINTTNYAQTDFTSTTNINTMNNDARQNDTQTTNISDVSNSMICTSSLDILVGLLNEIKNITCQTSITSAENIKPDSQVNNESKVQNDAYIEHRCKSSQDISSEQTKVQTKTSVYSLFVTGNPTDDDESQILLPELEETTREQMLDKEISAHIIEKCSCRDFSTGISTQLLPFSTATQSTSVKLEVASESTNVTDSVIGIFSEPSDHSIVLLHKGNLAMETLNRIINLNSDIDIPNGKDCAESNLPYHEGFNTLNDPKHSNFVSNRNIEDSKVEALPINTELTPVESQHVAKDAKQDVSKTEPAKADLKQDQEVIVAGCDQEVSPLPKSCSKTSLVDDGNIKLKRDVLVTVYSLLVFTVFAALSFPEVLLHT